MSHYIDRRGERKVANNGLMMEIIAYRSKDDIDIKFLEDGYTVTHKSYNHFQQGCIRHPNHTVVGGFKENQETKPGEQNVNTTGQLMTIKMLPFYGKAHVAYIPKGRITGLSKIARVVDIYSHRLQVQERLTEQIKDCIEQTLHPMGVMVVVEARHMCMQMRGVEKQNSITTTSAFSGAFNQAKTREEFMNLLRE